MNCGNTGNTGTALIHQDSDIADYTDCTDENICFTTDVTVTYAPLASSIIAPALNYKLLKVLMPIFVPPAKPRLKQLVHTKHSGIDLEMTERQGVEIDYQARN